MLNAQQAGRIQWKTARRAPDRFKKPKGTQKSGLFYLPHPVREGFKKRRKKVANFSYWGWGGDHPNSLPILFMIL